MVCQMNYPILKVLLLIIYILESDGGEDDWALTNYIEPADVGRPIERVQEKMENLGILPNSAHSSVSTSVSSDEPRGQPVSTSQQSNGEGSQKCKTGLIKYSLHK